MSYRMHSLLAAAVVFGATLIAGPTARADGDYCGPYSYPDLFYNYYVPPVACSTYPGAVGAQLYVSPRPVPPWVGHTYITYQPLLPHEFLYHHHRTYYRGHGPHGGLTKTTVWWH
jgi:hypothetical protein